MQTRASEIPGVIVIAPEQHRDRRGFFAESWQKERYAALGIEPDFAQDALSFSHGGVLRGLHYQISQPQGHLITVLIGRIFDVALDLRKGSPTFGRWSRQVLDGDRFGQVWLPAGVAHGFCVLSDRAMVHYKMSSPYRPGDEGGVHWADPNLAITWPTKAPVVSEKDAAHPYLRDIPENRLPQISFR